MTDNLPITPSEEEHLPAHQPTLDVEQVIGRFLGDYQARENTKALYATCVRRFFGWTSEQNIPVKMLRRINILEYKKKLTDQGLSSSTVGVNILALRRFFKWTNSEGLFPDIVGDIKGNKRQAKFKKMHLTLEQLGKWLRWFERKDSSHSLRDIAIAHVMARTGMRTIEIIRANVDDIMMRGGRRILLVHGKGRDEKDRFVIITDKCFVSLSAYIRSRKAEGEVMVAGDPLFASDSDRNYKERLTTRSIRRIAKVGLRGIGLNDPIYSAHSIRHTAAVHILKAGGGIEKAQEMLGHADPGTTQIYLESIKEEHRMQNPGEDLLDAI